MKRFLSCLAALAMVAFTCCVMPVPKAKAQYLGTAAQQTVEKTVSITMTATATHVALQNLGQAMHEIIYHPSAAANCTVALEASSDNVYWIVLAFVHGNLGSPFAFAPGFYTYLRLSVNETANSGCNGLVAPINYIGFQLPFSVGNPNNTVGPSVALGAPASILWITGNPMLWQTGSFQCVNPNASIAYLQLFDAGTTPTLGTAVLYEAGIPAGGSFSYTGTVLYGSNGLWAGAATTAGGSTAVSTPVQCSFQASGSGSPLPSWLPGT